MSAENRSSSALFKRAEQLKRWDESETNRESADPRTKSKKIQFSLECVFLAACASGDKDEVLRLLNVGADIDTSNVDGLSALHQACIDDNLDMVEFLVKHGADIDKGDNEGWTPLHATASCGFISIAKYLIEQGADVAAVNNDGELAVDIAESDEMEDMLNAVLKEKGINADEARNKEERIMLQDAREWLNSGKFEDIPHDKTGATALHVAASKGYIKVMDTLIQAGADVNAEDYDGWTPLHAAAHWGQKEACEILVENFCDMDKKNYVGQTAFDVSEGEMVRLLEELRKKQLSLQKERTDITIVNIKGSHSPKKWFTMDSEALSLKEKDICYDRLIMEEDISPMDEVPKVELTIAAERGVKTNTAEENGKHVRLINEDKQLANLSDATFKVPMNTVPSTQQPQKMLDHENDDVHVPSWRKPVNLRNSIKTPFRFEDEKSPWSNEQSNVNDENKAPEVVLRRTQSFEADDKFYRRYCELKAKIESGNTHPPLIPPANNTGSLPTRSASLKEKQRKRLMNEDVIKSTSSSQPAPYANTTTISNATNTNLPLTAQDANAAAAAAAAVSATIVPSAIRRSFVPPVRDEESETQRKAHAKRVRETRRSTQGVTLEEIKSAEQLVKKKQQQQQLQQAASSQFNSYTTPSSAYEPANVDVQKQNNDANSVSISATISTGTTTVPQSNQTASTYERRPSWRLRIDNGCKFMLEDAREKDTDTSHDNNWSPTMQQQLPSPPTTTNELTDTASVTLPLKKNNRFVDDTAAAEQTKNQSTTQPLNPRRKRTKRRSTGTVQFDTEEENDRVKYDNEVNDAVDDESGSGDKSGVPSRLGSTTSLAGDELTSRSTLSQQPNENGELDYKKLYEETLAENERLREKLRRSEDELTDAKSRLNDPSKMTTNKSSLSEVEKREKRAMERKLSEMEEELKQIEQIKQENQRLKDENGALIRVISKLSK